MPIRALPPLALLSVAGCYDQPVANDFGATTPPVQRPAEVEAVLDGAVTPVRIGELGPSFAACNAQGRVRAATSAGPIAVRAAPFEQARETGRVPPGTGFFICSRSMDQRWLGIVYDVAAGASGGCGVSAPAPSRRDYVGPCESGWVASAQVRLVSGVQTPAGEASRNVAESK